MTEDRKTIIEKIRKLLALSRDPANEHEAALAAEKARQLLDEYNVSIGEVEMEATPTIEFHIPCSANPDWWFASLRNLCDELFATESILVHVWPASPYLAVCGLPLNVDATVEALRYLADAIRTLVNRRKPTLVKKGKRSQAANARRLKSYRRGAAARVCAESHKLKVQAPQAEALVHVGRAIAHRHIEHHHKGFKLKMRKPPKADQFFITGWHDAEGLNGFGARKSLNA